MFRLEQTSDPLNNEAGVAESRAKKKRKAPFVAIKSQIKVCSFHYRCVSRETADSEFRVASVFAFWDGYIFDKFSEHERIDL